MENEDNSHIMITRSKQKMIEETENKDKHLVFERVDSNGNLSDLIDDSEPIDFDENLLKKEIERLRGGSPKKTKSPSKKIKKGKHKKGGNIIDLLLPYIIMRSLSPEMKKKKTRRGRNSIFKK